MKRVVCAMILGAAVLSSAVISGYRDGVQNPKVVQVSGIDFSADVDEAGEASIPNEDTYSPEYAAFHNADYDTLMHYANKSNDIPESVRKGIMTAADKSGVSPYLMFAIAKVETTTMDVRAKNPLSSATGLFQFTSDTWLRSASEHAEKHGMTNVASSIKINKKNNKVVVAPRDRKYILNMRNNPRISALFTAENLVRDKQTMEKMLGRAVTAGEMYLSHFFGWPEAVRFIRIADANPNLIAARQFGRAAKSNPGVFQVRNEKNRFVRHKTMREIRADFENRIASLTLEYVFIVHGDTLKNTVPRIVQTLEDRV